LEVNLGSEGILIAANFSGLLADRLLRFVQVKWPYSTTLTLRVWVVAPPQANL
jgi:hypothetical protein